MNNDSALILTNKQAEEIAMNTEKNVNKNYTEQVTKRLKWIKNQQLKKQHSLKKVALLSFLVP